MYRRFLKVIFSVSIILSPVLHSQTDLDVNQVMRLEWQEEMAQKETYYLNLSVWGLVQKGVAPPFSKKLLVQMDIDAIAVPDRIKVYLLLSLPSSLIGRPSLSPELAAKKNVLEENEYERYGLMLLDENWLPHIRSDAELKKNKDFLKYALQLFALSVFEAKSLNNIESEKLLFLIDKLIFYYGSWLSTFDTGVLIDKWRPHAESLQLLFATKSKKDQIKGEFAILYAEWSFIESFFKYRGKIW